MKAPEGIDDKALVLMADIFPTGRRPGRNWVMTADFVQATLQRITLSKSYLRSK
jgi:hypothetical protein